MNHEGDDKGLGDKGLDALVRLRASDPGAEVEAREGFADEIVGRVLGTVPVTAGGSQTPAAPVVELGSERARRRPGWRSYVAVAASLAIFGAGGYGIGAAVGGTSPIENGAAAPISLQSGGSNNGAVPEGGADGAVGGPLKTAPDAAYSSAMYPYGSGRNTFSASGLSTSEGTALAYGYDARAASTAERVAALAAALGVEGTPELKDGAWTVGGTDGVSPSISANLDGIMSFYFFNPLLDPWQCGEKIESAVPCMPSGELPSEEAATAALRTLIESLGLGPASFEFTSETWEGAVTRTVLAWPIVDGQRVNQPWSLELTEAGVYSAYGYLADIVSLGEYDIVSEQEAFERLTDPRFGAQMVAYPYAEQAVLSDAPVEWVPPTEPPATPLAGSSIAWPVHNVEIVSARLGLATQWQPDGSVIMVPAYEFTDADGGTWSMIAVADSMLDFATE